MLLCYMDLLGVCCSFVFSSLVFFIFYGVVDGCSLACLLACSLARLLCDLSVISVLFSDSPAILCLSACLCFVGLLD